MNTSAVGATLGHYRIDALIGTGGSGVVYRAFDTQLQRTVAIKLLQATSDESALSRVVREARAASALNHPNICTIHEVAQIDGRPYIVMEHVEGSPLGRLIPPSVGLPLDELLSYSAQIADGLAHAHARSIVHRDLKSANVMITLDGRVKILDFGLARKIAAGDDTETLTASGSAEVAGTPLYMAPETLRGQAAGPAADLWSMGVVMYEMAAGERPFAGATSYEITSAILRDAPARLPARVPPPVAAIIGKCLAKEPGQRYPRAEDVKEAIASAPAAQHLAFSRIRAHARRGLAAAAAMAAIGAVLLVVAAAGRWRARPPSTPVDLIAVVPQIVATGPDAEYLSDGISEDVINSLARSGGARVIALASALRYKGRTADPQTIRRELGATKLVSVRLAQLADSIAISAELTDLADGAHIWGERFDTKTTSLVSIAADITTAVAQALELQLTDTGRQRLTKRYTENVEAYQAYLRGRESWYKSSFGPEGYRQSLQYYEQAIAKDPGYALAYTGIADTYVSLAFDGWMHSGEALARAADAADKALAIDPSLGEAHYSRAGVQETYRHWSLAEQEFARALELNPGSPHIRRFHALYLMIVHRPDEAVAEMSRSLELDPLGLETSFAMAATLRWAGRLEEAIAAVRRTLDLDPDFAPAHQLLADLYSDTGHGAGAVAELQRVMALAGEPEQATAFGREYTLHGEAAAMQWLNGELLGELQQASRATWVSPIALAAAFTRAGDRDQAFRSLEQALEEGSAWLALVGVDPDFAPLRRDPRFAPFARRVGLP